MATRKKKPLSLQSVLKKYGDGLAVYYDDHEEVYFVGTSVNVGGFVVTTRLAECTRRDVADFIFKKFQELTPGDRRRP